MERLYPWVISKDPADFQSMVQFLLDSENGENLPEGWVPDSTYWLVTEDQQIVGAVNIRHTLTDKLLNSGGHIGYGIRPSERRKGYGEAAGIGFGESEKSRNIRGAGPM
jgi:predicted acetyltransferase